MLNLSEIPFHEKHLENQEWPLPKDYKTYMDEDAASSHRKEYQVAEDAVIWEGIHVSFDSCDCGDGYGCSHGSWPFEGKFHDDPDASFEWDDDSLYFEKNGKHVRVGPTDKMTMQDFKMACDVLGIKLTPRKESNPT